jgi:hypothetical protein
MIPGKFGGYFTDSDVKNFAAPRYLQLVSAFDKPDEFMRRIFEGSFFASI